ncbi:MAG: energy transducer TonB, partial [Saprospiraceae bacterium]|nr:energy transducer TonB [Saprospiraceae bacterium]
DPIVEKDAAPPPPAPPPPPPVEEEVAEIFKVVEQMPRFPGCETMSGNDQEKKACADKKLLEFIYENINYPPTARENAIQGTIVVQFVVERDGNISSAKVVREIGGGCGDEALRIIDLMQKMPQKWIPGKQRGRPVRVMFNLPIKFQLKNA